MRLASLLQMTLPGAPCVYYGDEIGMQGSMDPLCRKAFPADPAEWQRDPYAWMADVIALRHSSAAFRDAELSLLGAAGAAVAYLRRDGEEAFVIVANAEGQSLTMEVDLPFDAADAALVPLGGGPDGDRLVRLDGRSLRVSLPGRDGVVVRLTA
jgi:glycosidase